MNLSFELAVPELQKRARHSEKQARVIIVRDKRTQAIVRRFNLGGATLSAPEVAAKAVVMLARFAAWVQIPEPPLDRRGYQVVTRCEDILL